MSIEQEVEIALRLSGEILVFALLLLDFQQLGLGSQHQVFGDLAVAEQRFVDAQILLQQRFAGGNDLDRAARLQPIHVSNGDVTTERASNRHSIEAARIQQRALSANRGRNRRRI